MFKKVFISAAFLFFTFVVPVSATSIELDSNYRFEAVTSFSSSYTINKDGTVDVRETIDYNFPDQRHGIFREIPLSKENQDGDKLLMQVSSISVTDELGRSYIFQDNSGSQQISLKIGDPNRTITGAHTYVISYTVSGALTYFSDHDELFWNVTGNEWEVPIETASAAVVLPNSVTSGTDVICYTGVFGSTQQDCLTIGSEGGNLTARAENLLTGEGLSFAVSFPKGHVEVSEPIEDKLSLIEMIRAAIIALMAAGYYLVLPGILIYKGIKKIRKAPEEKRVVAAWFDPPKTPSGRELTAGEVGILHDRSGDVRDITASLIQLAQKGYFKISSHKEGLIIKKDSFTLVKQKEWLNSGLQAYEIDLLEDVFAGKEQIKLSELGKRVGFATKLDKTYKAISQQLVDDSLFKENPHTTRQKWFGLLVASFFLFNPLLIIATIIMAHSAKKTKAGGEAWAVVESMRNFVKTQEKQLDFQAKNQMFFEKLLPYATALGVEKVWAERFKDLKFAQPEWLESDTFTSFAYLNLMSSFNSSVSSAMAMSSTRSSSGFSSGFSGGFSGGGGGGGGGGSW